MSDDGVTWIDGTPFDAMGNPQVRLDGCPNCGKGKGWMDPMSYFGAKNSGRDPDGPCSRSCALQHDYAVTIASREVVEVAEGITAEPPESQP